MSDLWRSLTVGDRVQVVEWPSELHQDRLHKETKDFYEWLIETKTVLPIVEIDAAGLPWGKVYRIVDGVEQFEGVALNHSGLRILEEQGGQGP